MSLVEINAGTQPDNPNNETAELQKKEALAVIGEIAITGTSRFWGDIIEKHASFSGQPDAQLTDRQKADKQGYSQAFLEAFGPLYGQTILTFWEIRKPVREGKVSFELVARTREARQARIIAKTLEGEAPLRVNGLNPQTGRLIRFPGSWRGL